MARRSRFEILERIGQGGMGVVYKALDLRSDRLVALKFLPSHLGAEEVEQRRFLREARTASALDHAKICTIYQIGEAEDGRTFIAMAYCDGETLRERIARGPVPVEEAIRIGAKVVHGLAEAHARGIIHRDIKPGNIAITRDGAVKILDFGLATLNGATRITQADTTSGTVTYMSPEQLRGGPLDPSTDIWSRGVVMYEMLTGQPPFKGDHAPAVMLSIMNDKPGPISSVPAPFPPVARRGPRSPGPFDGGRDKLRSVYRSLEGLRSGAPADGRTRQAEARGADRRRDAGFREIAAEVKDLITAYQNFRRLRMEDP